MLFARKKQWYARKTIKILNLVNGNFYLLYICINRCCIQIKNIKKCLKESVACRHWKVSEFWTSPLWFQLRGRGRLSLCPRRGGQRGHGGRGASVRGGRRRDRHRFRPRDGGGAPGGAACGTSHRQLSSAGREVEGSDPGAASRADKKPDDEMKAD